MIRESNCWLAIAAGQVLICLAITACPAHAEGLNLPPETWGKDWTREDTYRQSVLTVLLVVDWGQTRYIAKHPLQHKEMNQFLGEHPSVGRVNNYFAASILGHAVISYILPPDWRKGWQYVWIGIEFGVVQRNHSIGIKVDF